MRTSGQMATAIIRRNTRALARWRGTLRGDHLADWQEPGVASSAGTCVSANDGTVYHRPRPLSPPSLGPSFLLHCVSLRFQNPNESLGNVLLNVSPYTMLSVFISSAIMQDDTLLDSSLIVRLILTKLIYRECHVHYIQSIKSCNDIIHAPQLPAIKLSDQQTHKRHPTGANFISRIKTARWGERRLRWPNKTKIIPSSDRQSSDWRIILPLHSACVTLDLLRAYLPRLPPHPPG